MVHKVGPVICGFKFPVLPAASDGGDPLRDPGIGGAQALHKQGRLSHPLREQ